MKHKSNRLLALITSLALLGATFSASANAEITDSAGATAVNFFWQAPTHSEMTWLTRDVVVTKSGEGTYFSIIGNWNPPFYLGVQDYKHPRSGGRNKIAIFSAWDTYDKNDCMTCGPETRPTEGRTVVKDLGPDVYSGGFGYEGTGAQGFIWDFDWKIGDRIRAVVNLKTVSDGTEISAALQLNDSKWRYFGTYKYSKKFNTLEPGYSFIEDFLKTPRTVRAAEYGNTWMENDDLSLRTPINFVQARANTDPNTQYHLIKQLNPTSLWAQVGGDEFISKQEYVPAKIEVSEDLLIPLDARVTALNLSGDLLKKYEDKYLQDKTKRESMIKAAAEKAAAELRITAAKSKYSKLNSEIDRLIKQYPSKKSEIELYKKKITLFERIDQVNVANVELNLAGIESKLVAMRSVYGKIARTITCTKGKLTKKITAVSPKCPAGYKKK
jgi:hypothetical protein